MLIPDQSSRTVAPDYQCSLANLAARLHGTTACPALQHPLLDDLESATTIILLLIDGMGQAQLSSLCADGWMAKQDRIRLQSVFPSTTTAAITTLMTGLPPSQHSLVAWHLWAPELDAIATPLPLSLHWPDEAHRDGALMAQKLYSMPSALRDDERHQYVLQPMRIADSAYSRHHGGQARAMPWRNYDELFDSLQKLSHGTERKYVYAYIPDLDSLMHDLGTQHHKADRLLRRLDTYIQQLAANLGERCTLLITADHGQLDVPSDRFLFLNDYPEVAECLLRPLSGEPRAAFCHVKPACIEAFPDLVALHLGHAVDCVPVARVITEEWFGPGPNHPLLPARLGDYVLMPRENWAIMQTTGSHKRPALLGNHGGLDRAEMEIPLLVVKRSVAQAS